MKIQEFFQKIRGIFSHAEKEIPDPVVDALLRTMLSHKEDCGCDGFFTEVDQYAEMRIKGEDVERLMPLIKNHLEMCHDCCEEYEALLRILEQNAAA
jgi:hypothetical protein